MVIDVGISKYYGTTASYLLFFAFLLQRSTDFVRWKYERTHGLWFSSMVSVGELILLCGFCSYF